MPTFYFSRKLVVYRAPNLFGGKSPYLTCLPRRLITLEDTALRSEVVVSGGSVVSEVMGSIQVESSVLEVVNGRTFVNSGVW